MFKKGDPIVHPRHGAGIVADVQMWEMDSVERRYYCIELSSGQGMLMVPVDQAEESGLRPAMADSDAIIAILSDGPQELAADYRERQAHIAAKVRSGDPKLVAQALRDLAWREHDTSLTSRDMQLKAEAQELLASELALQPGQDVDTVVQRLDTVIQQAIRTHLASRGSQAASPGV
jgi:RNA polymerase-interacting CarD/CdnL/TRCF family regulator